MKEKLIIRNFGPIKSVELELGRFNVLIGEQATGKSTVAKVLAVCRYFSYIIDNKYFLQITESNFFDGLTAWGIFESVKDDSYIEYACKHYTLIVEQRKAQVWDQREEALIFTPQLRPISKEFTDLLSEFDKIQPEPVDIHGSPIEFRIPTSFFKNDVARVMDNPFYLPAERGLQSIFSLGKASIQNISDALFNQLANLDRIARFFKDETVIEPLDIMYKNVDGRGYVRKNTENQYYSLFNAASGYKSAIPIVLVSKYYNEIRKQNKTFIIEEPELDLFPLAQQKLIQYLVGDVLNHGSQVLIETHSPYILTSINNLIYAYKVGRSDRMAVNEIIPEKCWLNPAHLSAYRLLTDGTCRNIIDKDLEEIAVEELDEAGKKMNEEYDKVLNIKFHTDEKFK